MATYLLSFGTDLPMSGTPASEGAVDLSRFPIYGDMSEALVPVAIVCAISLLCTGLWLLAAGTHLRSGGAQHT